MNAPGLNRVMRVDGLDTLTQTDAPTKPVVGFYDSVDILLRLNPEVS